MVNTNQTQREVIFFILRSEMTMTCVLATMATMAMKTEENAQRSLRKREVALSRINIYIVFIIVTCHSIRWCWFCESLVKYSNTR